MGATGEVITSRRGELSIDVSGLEILSKAPRPLPDKWHGLSEAETRYRQREVDLLANSESRRVFDIRFRTLSILRDRLEGQGFLEVETPILQPQAGGALARPFFTHANALDAEFSLRIAPELYLKRLVVGGYGRVFEVARNFRNEGIDTRHSPEFTSLEAYRAFGRPDAGRHPHLRGRGQPDRYRVRAGQPDYRRRPAGGRPVVGRAFPRLGRQAAAS